MKKVVIMSEVKFIFDICWNKCDVNGLGLVWNIPLLQFQFFVFSRAVSQFLILTLSEKILSSVKKPKKIRNFSDQLKQIQR